jgi:Ca-activated chloride channel homolog
MFKIGNYDALWLLFLVPLLLVPLYLWCFYRKDRALRQLADSVTLPRINTQVSTSRQILKAVLLIAAFIMITIALTEPGWNPQPREIKRKGRDVVVLLDVSRSMLAEDLKPNRLERAKIAINDLIEVMAGDRIGLITFAGSANIAVPLTQDYGFMRMVLDTIGTESTLKGGTMLGDAVRKAHEKLFDTNQRAYMDLIIITDGEDHGSFPVDAAAAAGKDGIRIITVGLGSETNGALIPIYHEHGSKTFLEYEGEPVRTKLDSATLAQMAAASTGGKYLPVETGNINLDQVYLDLVADAEKRQLESTTLMEYDEKFQIFLALAVILIAMEAVISERRKS